MDQDIKDRAIAHLRKHSSASVRDILKASAIKSMRQFYRIFPGGLEEACKLAGIPFKIERRARMARATKARRVVPMKVGHDGSISSEFDMALRISKIEADFDALNKEFLERTEERKSHPYWSAQRRRFNSLCDGAKAMLHRVGDEKGFAEAGEVYRKMLDEFSGLLGEAPWFEQSRFALGKLQERFQAGPGEALEKAGMVVQFVDKHGLDRVEAFLRSEDLLSYDRNLRVALAKKWVATGALSGLDEATSEIMYVEGFGKNRKEIPLREFFKVDTLAELRQKPLGGK